MKMKKTLVVCLLLCLVFSSYSSVFAESRELTIDEQLLLMNVPAELLDSMDEKLKLDILENGEEFISYSTSTQTLDNSAPNNDDDGMFGTMTISSSDLSFSTYTIRTTTTNNRERFHVYVTWNWLNYPFWRLTDVVGVSWSDKWRPVDGSAYLYERYCAGAAPMYCPQNGTYHIFESYDVATSSPNGVGWDVDIRGTIFPSGNVSMGNGFGRITMESTSTGSVSGSDQIFASYFHAMGTGSVGLNIKALSITFDGGASQDSVSTWHTFDY